VELAGRVAIVTGGANGMGRELVRQLVAAGARVATCDYDDAGLARLREELPDVHASHVDLADAGERRRFVAQVRAALGPVDVLVNDAGVGVGGPLAEITNEDDWTWIRGVNLDAPIDLMGLVVPEMKARGAGRILNVSSIAGLTVQPYIATYTATKHALFGFSRAAHEELRHYGVTVTVACPGPVRTDIVAHGRLRRIDVAGVMGIFRLGIEPATAASRMLAAMRRGRPVVIPNHDVRLLYVLYRVAPRAFDALVGRLAHRAYRAQERAARIRVVSERRDEPSATSRRR
jgi:NAD(P)-dependent dehydrogenase (short-subunit alcohol dehydrogenase family)